MEVRRLPRALVLAFLVIQGHISIFILFENSKFTPLGCCLSVN